MKMAGDSVAKVKRKAKIACDEQATVSDLRGGPRWSSLNTEALESCLNLYAAFVIMPVKNCLLVERVEKGGQYFSALLLMHL
jgi:hypothetical protein